MCIYTWDDWRRQRWKVSCRAPNKQNPLSYLLSQPHARERLGAAHMEDGGERLSGGGLLLVVALLLALHGCGGDRSVEALLAACMCLFVVMVGQRCVRGGDREAKERRICVYKIDKHRPISFETVCTPISKTHDFSSTHLAEAEEEEAAMRPSMTLRMSPT